MSLPLLKTINLDDVLGRFSMFDRYHTVAALWITLAFMLNALNANNFIFIAEEVRYRCADINGMGTNVISNRSLNLSNAEDTIEICRVPETCARWVYDDPDSFVAEFQLACQDWKRTLVGTAHSFGYMIGLLIVGPLSDKFGRKSLAILAGVTGGLCGFAKSFITVYWIYIAFEFMGAAFGDNYSPLFMLALEMVASKSRAKYTTICNMGYPTGGILLPLIYWWISYWRNFLRVLHVAELCLVFFIFYLDESPRWLLTKGNVKAVAKIINNAAKKNIVEIKENLEMLTYEKDNSSNFTTAIAETFKSRTLLKSFLACTTWWIASVFVSYGLSINSVTLDGNKYVNYALSAAVEYPGNIIMLYLIDNFNRKPPLICSFVACAMLCVGQPFIPNNLHWLSISMYMLGKLLSTTFFTITYIFTSELFPTYTRNSMHALCSSIGRIGGIAAPLTPLLMVYWSGLPTMLFGVVSLLGGLVTFIVTDTGEKSLPDTVSQAETLGVIEEKNRLEERKTSSRTNEDCTYL